MSFRAWCPDRGEQQNGAKVFRALTPEEAAQAWAEDADAQYRLDEAFGRGSQFLPVEESGTFDEEADESEPGCVVLVARGSEEPERYRVTAETRVVYEAEREA
jgi:hypothetical protein